MDNIIEAKNINKHFLEPVKFHVLKDISFAITKGEFVSIMGKSGCGKSTLLYILSTMDTEYEGQLHLDGELLKSKTKNELARIRSEKIGFIFQFHYLLDEFSVLDNVMLPALKLGHKSHEEIRIDALNKLDVLGIKNQADKKASRLSGGQKQRVAIARALINNPKIIMGDEPTGNLDSNNASNIFTLFKSLTISLNLSFLVVTHDHDFAAQTDRIITLGDGEIIDYGYNRHSIIKEY